MKMNFLSLILPFFALVVTAVTIPPPSIPLPRPNRLFTIAAYNYPWAPGYGDRLTGVPLVARDGTFWLSSSPTSLPAAKNTSITDSLCSPNGCPPRRETVLYIDGEYGFAYLNSNPAQRIFIDTVTGILSYTLSRSASPYYSNFLRRGAGTRVYKPSGPDVRFANPGDSLFVWVGADKGNYWEACRVVPDGDYQIRTFVGGDYDWNSCVTLELIALDYGGVSPATEVYL